MHSLCAHVLVCCVSFPISPPHSSDTDLNRVGGTSRPVYRLSIVLRKLIWAWNGNRHSLRRTLRDSVMLNARRRLLTADWCAQARCLCVFSHSRVTLQWHFIIWVTSSKVGSTSYPDEKLTQASATAASWKSLAPVYATMYNIFHWRFSSESAGGQDRPRGTEDKSDKLKEDYQARKRRKENSSVTQAVSFSFNFL